MTSSADGMGDALVPVQVKLLRPGARFPERGSEQATGWDLYACLSEDITVTQAPTLVPTGVAIAFPPGWDAQVRPRSGLARRGVLCSFGTIDADYRGELLVNLYATAPGIDYVVRDGDRIGQLVFSRLAMPVFERVDELDATIRGAGGHGSTGR